MTLISVATPKATASGKSVQFALSKGGGVQKPYNETATAVSHLTLLELLTANCYVSKLVSW